MKQLLLKIFRVRYFLVALLLGTVLILILNPNYLYDKGEYFKTDYMRYFSSDHFSFLPENPFYDIINLISHEKDVTLYYRNLNTEAVKQIELPGYSVNLELGGGFNGFYYDNEDKTIQIILTTNGADYYLFEFYNPDNKFEVNAQKIFHYNLYDELQSKWIRIKKIQFFPSKLEDQTGKSCIITKLEDGYKISFNIETLQKLRRVPITDIENDDLYLSICDEMKKSIGTEYVPADVFEIIQFLFRNSYYKKMFFSKNGINNKGFLGAKIVGKIDSNDDGQKEYLIHIKGKRWINDLLICYDKAKRQIIWKKEFIYGISDNIKIFDIDDDGIEEIILSTIAYCNEFPIDWFRKKDVGESYRSYFYILENNGKTKIINEKPVIVKSEPGFFSFKYLLLPEQKRVLLGFGKSGEKKKEKLLVLNLKKNEINETNIQYNNLIKFDFENENIIAIDRYKKIFKKIVISKDFKLKKIQTKKVANSGNYLPNRILINNKRYFIISNPFSIVDDNLRILYKRPCNLDYDTIHWKNNTLYFKELDENKSYLSSITFSRNKKLNPYLFIIILAELLIILLYFFVYHHIKIPMVSTTSSYFILYSFFGRIYYWRLQGRLKTIYKLPKKISVDEETPINILNEISDDNELRYQRNFFLLKYKVFEISSTDEFQIIQRISHEMKNQILLLKLMTEQYEKSLKIKNKDFVENMFSSLKDISSSAVTLSNFSHINKLYKEKVKIISFIESIISQYVNHPLFERICHSVKSRTQSEKNPQRQTNEESPTECLSEELLQSQTNEESTTEESSFRQKPDTVERKAIRQLPDQENKSFFVNIDKSLFQIAFKNLLNNALEAIDENGYVKVEISEIKDDVVIEMRNPFDKLDSSCKPESGLSIDKIQEVGFSTKEKGSGLGIPISKAIIERHKGTLDISIKENEFIVRIILAAKSTPI